jgi:hypothetical protein
MDRLVQSALDSSKELGPSRVGMQLLGWAVGTWVVLDSGAIQDVTTRHRVEAFAEYREGHLGIAEAALDELGSDADPGVRLLRSLVAFGRRREGGLRSRVPGLLHRARTDLLHVETGPAWVAELGSVVRTAIEAFNGGETSAVSPTLSVLCDLRSAELEQLFVPPYPFAE